MSKYINPIIIVLSLLLSAAFADTLNTPIKRSFVKKRFTFETAHFRLNYDDGLKDVAAEVATILEGLYSTYRDKYGITLPNKTEVIVSNGAQTNGWALAIQNTIAIWANDFDWNMRGTPNWLENVVAHEYAHIVSISCSFKFPSWMAYLQLGYFSHPNESNQVNAMHIYPNEILPPWFFEGIAQLESSNNNGDSWDSHRDMILRELALNDSLISWDHMSVFNGRGDDYEKTYNHGFSLLRYIQKKYGHDKIALILRASSKFMRLSFDRSIKEILGISGKQLYADWKDDLTKGYINQVSTLGDTTVDSTISISGYNNFWPKFGPNNNKIYYLSNGSNLWYGANLYSYNLVDTAIEKEDDWDTLSDSSKNELRTRIEVPQVTQFFDINSNRELIYSDIEPYSKTKFSLSSKKINSWNINSVTLPDDSGKVKTKKRKDINHLVKDKMTTKAVWGPGGKKIALIQHDKHRYTLWVSDSSQKNYKQIFPAPNNPTLSVRTIYSLDWSSDGSKIAVSYIDRDNRKVGYYDFKLNQFFNIKSINGSDDRDPRFTPDSKELLFSSDKTGIFNIYRYSFSSDKLEKLTNVVGGAFTPDISNDGKSLIYSSYTPEGYKIKLLKIENQPTITSKGSLKDNKQMGKNSDSLLNSYQRITPVEKTDYISGANDNYNYFPRKLLFIPTLISEELLSDQNNTYKGVRNTKYGAIALINDPLFWVGDGTSLMLFFLSEKYFKFIQNIGDKSKNKEIATDFGAMINTDVMPFNLSLSYFFRNIPSTNDFIQNAQGFDTIETSEYALQPQALQLEIAKKSRHTKVGLFGSYMAYKVQVNLTGESSSKTYYGYTPATILRDGALLSYHRKSPTNTSQISPHGVAAKIQIEHNYGGYADQERVLIVDDNGKIKENIHNYTFGILKTGIKWGKTSFLAKQLDFEMSFNAAFLGLSKKSQKLVDELVKEEEQYKGFPQFFRPSIQVPGYTFSYRADSVTHVLVGENGDTTYQNISEDSVLASGDAVINTDLSWRFPLSGKNSIDKKVAFLYFDKIYGAINAGGALVSTKLTSLTGKRFKDALYYGGAELRMESIIFNNYPFNISLRWDHGFSQPKPIGGDRFTFSLGFDFNSWGVIESPDGAKLSPTLMDGYR